MPNKKFSRFPFANVGIVCLLSGIGFNALNLTIAAPAVAGCGFLGLNKCPPKQVEPPSGYQVDLNLPNFDGKNVASCLFHNPDFVDTATGGGEKVLSCSQTARDRISNSYCYKKGFSSAKYWKVYDGNSSTRRQTWLLYLVGNSYKIMESKGTWYNQPADSYFTRIDCNN